MKAEYRLIENHRIQPILHGKGKTSIQVVEIFEPLEDHLSPAEVKKLEYARKKVASAN